MRDVNSRYAKKKKKQENLKTVEFEPRKIRNHNVRSYVGYAINSEGTQDKALSMDDNLSFLNCGRSLCVL